MMRYDYILSNRSSFSMQYRIIPRTAVGIMKMVIAKNIFMIEQGA